MYRRLRARRRGQCDGERIAGEHHERDQPPDRDLLVIDTEHCRHVADGRGLGLDPAALGGQGGALGLEGGPVPAARFCSSTGLLRGLRCPSMTTGRCWSPRRPPQSPRQSGSALNSHRQLPRPPSCRRDDSISGHGAKFVFTLAPVYQYSEIRLLRHRNCGIGSGEPFGVFSTDKFPPFIQGPPKR
jgi:hypothetical protein